MGLLHMGLVTRTKICRPSGSKVVSPNSSLQSKRENGSQTSTNCLGYWLATEKALRDLSISHEAESTEWVSLTQHSHWIRVKKLTTFHSPPGSGNDDDDGDHDYDGDDARAIWSGEFATWPNATGGDHSGGDDSPHSSRRRSLPQERPQPRRIAHAFL